MISEERIKQIRGTHYPQTTYELCDEVDALRAEVAALKSAAIRRAGASSWEEAFGDWNPTEESAEDAIKRLVQALAEAQKQPPGCPEGMRIKYLQREVLRDQHGFYGAQWVAELEPIKEPSNG